MCSAGRRAQQVPDNWPAAAVATVPSVHGRPSAPGGSPRGRPARQLEALDLVNEAAPSTARQAAGSSGSTEHGSGSRRQPSLTSGGVPSSATSAAGHLSPASAIPSTPVSTHTPSRSPAEGRQWPSGYILIVVAAATAMLTQLAVTATLWHRTADGAGRALSAVLLAAKLAALLVAFKCPTAMWNNRFWAVPAIRVLFHLLPVVRSVGVGSSLLLERAAQPGWLGAAADIARVMAGTRALGIAVGGATIMMPPAVTLLTQTLLTLLVSNNAAYCATPLLQHIGTQRRATLLARLLEYATLPILALQSVASQQSSALARGDASPDRVCQATLAFAQVALIVVLPTLLSVYCWTAPERRATGAVPSAAGALPSAVGRQPRCLAATLASLSSHTAQAFAAADRALWYTLRNPAGLDSRVVVCWWLLAICWWCCKRSLGLQ